MRPSSSPAVRPAARLSAPMCVSRIEPATSENRVTTCTPVRTSSLIASFTGGRSGAISATPSQSASCASSAANCAASAVARRCVTSVMCWWRNSPAACAISRSTSSTKGDGSAGSTKAKRKFSPLRGRPRCGGEPSSATTCSTRCTVSALTPGRLLSTRSTVAVPTPARAAMSAMVAVADMVTGGLMASCYDIRINKSIINPSGFARG